MMTTRSTLLCLALVVALAALTQAKAAHLTNADNGNNVALTEDDAISADHRVRRQVDIAQRFQQLINMMMAMFNPQATNFNRFSPVQNIKIPRFPAYIPAFAPAAAAAAAAAAPATTPAPASESQQPQEPQALPLQGEATSQQEVSVSVSSTATTCNPPCTTGSQCCLRMPGEAVASCRYNRLSGKSCGWNHYTSSHPSTTVALVKSSCPCMIGMACLSATENSPGTCSFL